MNWKNIILYHIFNNKLLPFNTQQSLIQVTLQHQFTIPLNQKSKYLDMVYTHVANYFNLVNQRLLIHVLDKFGENKPCLIYSNGNLPYDPK